MADDNRLRDRRNEVIRLVTDAWLAAPAVVGMPGPFIPLVLADGSEDDIPKGNPQRKPWARLRVQHTASAGTSISGRSYRNNGTITINVFVNRDSSDAWNKCQLIGDALKLAIRKHRGNVYFKDVTLRERPVNNGFSQTDVSAAFWWTEFSGVAK